MIVEDPLPGLACLLFLSGRSGSSEVWKLAIDEGEPSQVTDLALDVEGLRIAPDRGALFVALSVFPDCEDALPCTVSRLESQAQCKTTGRVYDHLLVRHWDFWKDGRRNHLFRIAIDDGAKEGIERLAGSIDYIELSSDKRFNDIFIKRLSFSD